ncbi:MAG: hypothetical protein ABW148_04765 [Sedimenticola sp.]
MIYDYCIDRNGLWPTAGELPHPLSPDGEVTRVWKRLDGRSLCRVIGSLLAQPHSPARALAVLVIIEARAIGSGITLAVLGYIDETVPAKAREHHAFPGFVSRLATQAQGERLQCVVYCHPYGMFWPKGYPDED